VFFPKRSVLVMGLVCAALILPAGADAAGAAWVDATLDKALARAKAEKKRLIVKFEADWCGPCRRLGKLLEEPVGAQLTKGMLGVRVDFDDEKNRKHIQKYVVLGLPTVVVLDGNGTQVARIMGYDDREAWLAEARAGITASDPLPKLRAAAKQRPMDPVACLRLGKALLVRGEAKEGVALIERTGWLAAASKGDLRSREAAAEALFVLGRYHHRVRRDPRTAQHVWRQLALGHAASGFAGGAWWWYARSQKELGRPDVGVAALRSRAQMEPGNLGALRQWASFVSKHALKSHAREVLEALKAARGGKTGKELDKIHVAATKLRALIAAK